MKYLRACFSAPEDKRQRAIERFDWLADELRDAVSGVDVADLQQTLHDPEARTAAKERALVMLGLLASAHASAVLAWFDPAGEHWRVRMLHRLVVSECARRRAPAVGPRRARRRAA